MNEIISQHQNLNSPNLKAFIIMPYGSEFDKIFNDLVKQPLEESGYEVIRADSILDQHNILKDIIRNIAEADLIIADLTSINPNVFYELGIAHAMQVPTVLLSQSIEDVPFDLKSYRVIVYSTRYYDATELPRKLIEITDKAKNNNLSFGNPVSDFLPEARIKRSENKKIDLEKQEIEKIIDVEEEKGLWDFIEDAENSTNIINDITKKITDETKNIGDRIKSRTDEITQIYNSGVPGTASRIQKIITNTSFDLMNYSNRLEKLQPEFHKAWVELDDNMRGLLKIVKIRSEEDKKSTIEFKNKINNLKDVLSKSSEAVSKFKDSINSLRGQKRELNIASNRVVKILDLLITDIQGAESYTTKIIDLIDEKLNKT
jgi:hypothetical protein